MASNMLKTHQQNGYTLLRELQPGSNVNVYAVIRFMAYSKDLKVMLFDEDETPIFCQLYQNQHEGLKYSNYPLCSDMIVRIHRCIVKSKPDNEKVIVGTINVAGLNIVGWEVEDEHFQAKFKTSNKYTLDPEYDHKRISELRKFWKNRMKYDGLARLHFMANCKEEIDLEGLAEKQSKEGKNKQEEEDKSHFIEESRSAACPLNEEYFEKLKKHLNKWKQEMQGGISINELTFYQKEKGEFFNINCQILSILEPNKQYQKDSSKPVYLRICDGTIVNPESGTRGIFPPESHHVSSDLFNDRYDYASVRDYVHYISCFEEFAEEAKRIQPGDFVEILNCHAKISGAYGRYNHMFSLRGQKNRLNQEKYIRRIKLLERPEKGNGEAGNTIGKRSNAEKRDSTEEEPERKKAKEDGLGLSQRDEKVNEKEANLKLLVKEDTGAED